MLSIDVFTTNKVTSGLLNRLVIVNQLDFLVVGHIFLYIFCNSKLRSVHGSNI